ncbi:MAG: M14 family metallopeptidase [Maricaulaceae bacterium]|jgi:succinylglutamate desuccinylase
MQLDRLDHAPDALLDVDPREIRRVLPNPTLIEIAGREPRPLFLSVLLHGNEPTGLLALQKIAREFVANPPPRALMIFVGNVAAAEQGARLLPGQTDFNRIWAGGASPETRLAAEVAEAARAAAPFASIDIHNNTGANPLYSCVNSLAPEHVGLAALFSRTIVYYDNPPTTQSMQFSKFCPATTIECGKPGSKAGVERAAQFVLDVLHAHALPGKPPRDDDVRVYQTVGRLEAAPGARLQFGGAGDADVVFAANFDHLNFTDLPAGAELACVRTEASPLRVLDKERRDLTAKFLMRDGDVMRLAQPATPAMLTTDVEIIRQDCVGYLMERLTLADA